MTGDRPAALSTQIKAPRPVLRLQRRWTRSPADVAPGFALGIRCGSGDSAHARLSFPPPGPLGPPFPPSRRLQQPTSPPRPSPFRCSRPAEAEGRPVPAPPVPRTLPSCTHRERPPGRARAPEPPGPAPLPSLLPRIRQHRFCSRTFGDFWSGVAILARDCLRGLPGAAGTSPPASSPSALGRPRCAQLSVPAPRPAPRGPFASPKR